MIPRTSLEKNLRIALKRSPIVVLLGPRQCGKSTLAREISSKVKSHVFDLEHPGDLAFFDQPMTALEALKGLVVLDEIQRKPDILSVLRVLADRRPLPARFLLLGSASPEVIRNSSESLAGRAEFIDMGGFSIDEIGTDQLSRHWLRGGFPRSFLAKSDSESFGWRNDFIRTFLERDLPTSLGIKIPAATLRRFWMMLAHYHGQIWNGSELGRAMGLTDKTVRHYLDLLTGSFMVRQLQPWFANIGKRQVKSPKIFFRDSGLFHALLDLPDRRALLSHPRIGASWEGFMIEQVLFLCGKREAFFWGTQAGAELDLLITHRGKNIGFEFKYSDAPALTPSMTIASRDLNLAKLWVIYPGTRRYLLAPHIETFPSVELPSLPTALASCS
ncbi:MAG: ATP-binding protein [Candidatus Riflebacteria bacterium]|nr:ATP-binding protein [Candidatus Riflebacteria bacterium]